MDITAMMLEYMLQRQGIAVRALGNPNCVVRIASILPSSDARRASGSSLMKGVAYIDLQGSQKAVPSASDGYVLLVSNSSKSKADQEGSDSHAQFDELTVADRANTVISKLEEWDLELKDALIANSTLPDLARIGEKVLDIPFCFVDANLNVLMRSQNYGSDEDMSYCINTYQDGVCVARFVSILERGSGRLHLGQEQLLIHFDAYPKALYRMLSIGSPQASRQEDSLHRILATASERNDILDARILQDELSSYRWAIDDAYRVMWIKFQDNASWSSAGYYMACQMESRWPSSCAISMERGIMWVLNVSRMQGSADSDAFRKAYEKLLADYACKCGESQTFDNLSQLPRYLKEARLALEYGSRKNPAIWRYSFADYAFDYVMDKSVAELLPEQVCEESLVKLLDIDRTSGTDYARTLVCYLRQDCSSTHAADELFIHRTTLLHRLDKIAELTQVDLDDPDQKLTVLLSAKMLGM